MSSSLPLPQALVDSHPDAVSKQRSRGPNGRSLVSDEVVHDLQRGLLASMSRVLTGDTSLVSADGLTQTIAAYEIDLSAGDVLVGGVPARLAALDDEDLLSIAALAAAVKLDGTAAAALSADGKTYDVALVAILVSGAVALAAVFGDEADDASEVAPTADDCRDALIAAAIANHDQSAGLIVARFKIQRVATDTITMTHTDPASDDALWAERQRGTIWPAL